MKQRIKIWMEDPKYWYISLAVICIVCIAVGIVLVSAWNGNAKERSTQERKTTLMEENTTMEITTVESIRAEETTAEETTQEDTTVGGTESQMEEVTEIPTSYVPQVKNTSEHIVAIDPGHQAHGNFEKEPIGPGAAETKNKVAGGTRGVVTGIPEYELTLEVALKLKNILLERGYQVIMIRESHDVDISNAERAQAANDAGADAFIRIHADASDAGSASGMTALCQTADNPYNGSLYTYSRALTECMIHAMAEYTGAKNRGIWETDTMSGINWAQVPTTIIEMGFMTNETEDSLMATEDYQNKLAFGMADGVDAYFAGLE